MGATPHHGAVDDDHQDRGRDGTLQQIYALAAAGADILRCTCNREKAAEGRAQIIPAARCWNDASQAGMKAHAKELKVEPLFEGQDVVQRA